MSVDITKAETILNSAYEMALSHSFTVNADMALFIDTILNNTHKTYKYILMTALLGKATNPSINPLALQAGAPIDGAYDARSLCHSVIVPFEMNKLNHALGGSNEPFLNKPARATHLDKSNPVRRGNDQILLNTLCDYLPQLTAENSIQMLSYALSLLIEKSKSIANLSSIEYFSNNSSSEILTFIDEALKENNEGETSALIVGGLYDLYMKQFPNSHVNVNPVNQSGASGNEISDVDVYQNGKLFITNEVKDKTFRYTDVSHAIQKVEASGFNKMNFVKGFSASLEDGTEIEIEQQYQNKNFLLRFVNVKQLASELLQYTPDPSVKDFWTSISSNAINKKFKERTIAYFVKLAGDFYWK